MTARETYFALRGWVLATLFLGLVLARLASEAPLRPEWLIYVAAAVALRLWAGAHLGEHGNAARPEAVRLCRTGPYRRSRNPLYASNILAGAGLIFYANALPLPAELALVLVVIAHHVLLVRHEEAILRSLHGAGYADYAAHTPRWYGLARPRALTAAKTEDGEDRVPPGKWLRRQGRNVLYTLSCVLILWIAARW
jgi:protein-S-isoprenylcysteine O-methyltransferase Ste14